MDDKNRGKQAGKPCVLALSAPYSSNASLHQSSARKALPARKLWKSSLLPVWKGRKGKHKNGRTFRRNVPTFSLRPRSSCSVFVYLFWWLQKDSTKAAKFPETTRHWRSPPQLASEVYQSTFSNASWWLMMEKIWKKWEQFDAIFKSTFLLNSDDALKYSLRRSDITLRNSSESLQRTWWALACCCVRALHDPKCLLAKSRRQATG